MIKKSVKATELRAGDIAWLKSTFERISADQGWYRIRQISRHNSSGGCSVVIWVEGVEIGAFCSVRGSSKVCIQKEIP